MIRTPDQRVRVFVSSTLQELATERQAVKQAIEKLRLIPVLFELSARHHPPQALYRDYLSQSDVFVGIYYQKYGWVAPDMSISGLEDEYRMANGMPMLVYVKHAEDREAGLNRLLKDIQQRNILCYRPFSTLEELRELVENDLAILLSEHFQAEAEPGPPTRYHKLDVPTVSDILVGREKDIDQLSTMLSSGRLRLITICGTGGTGKTRLSIEVAHRLQDVFPNGIIFISLEAITDPELVPAIIAERLNITDSGKQSMSETLMSWLSDKKMLLILDNLEQVISSGTFLSGLLQRCSNISLLATSRTPLHIRYEQIYPLDPLPVPLGLDPEELTANASVQLFIQRMREVNPKLELTPEDMVAIQTICNRLDGLPLAIELAALRIRYSTPSLIIRTIKSSLDLASKGPVDLPDRQKTLRATIAWSVQLLHEDEQNFMYALSIFHGGWTSDAAMELAGNFIPNQDPFELMERLIDLGLIYRKASTQRIRFDWLTTIREYAREEFLKRHAGREMEKKYYRFYAELTHQHDPLVRGISDQSSYIVLKEEFENIRAAFNLAIQYDDLKTAWKFPGALSMYWLSVSKLSEALDWMDRAQIRTDYDVAGQILADQVSFSRSLMIKGLINYFAGHYLEAVEELQRSIAIFKAHDDSHAQSIGYAYLGLAGLSQDHPDTESWFLHAIELGKASNESYSQILALTFLAEIRLSQNDTAASMRLLDQAEALCHQGYETYLSVNYVVRAATLLALGQPEKALTYYLESLRWFDQSGFKATNGWALIGAAFCHLWLGNTTDSIQYLHASIENGRNSGDPVVILIPAMGLGVIQVNRGEIEAGSLLFLMARRHFSQLKYRAWRAIRQTIEKLDAMMEPYIKQLSEPTVDWSMDELIRKTMEIQAQPEGM
ncbi:MAG: DUF4062 domain-containing protein [Saprospiraceae bacterium]